MHSHQCGLTALGPLPDLGCGHIWSHERGAFSEHYCPRCGAGPFTFQIKEIPRDDRAIQA